MIKYRKPPEWKYQLLEDFKIFTGIKTEGEINTDFIWMLDNGLMYIKKGYAWDGPTWGIDTENFMTGSLAHDCLCQLISLGLLPQSKRIEADILLRKICLNEGMSELRAWWVYRSVRIFVWFNYKRKK